MEKKQAQPGTPTFNLKSWNGPRAIASAMVAVFHVQCIYMGLFSEKETVAKERSGNLLLLLIINGTLAVDMFKVLTGALAAYSLLPPLISAVKRKVPTRAIVYNYFRRRVVKIFPIYLTGLALSTAVAWHGSRTPPTNFAAAAAAVWFAGCPQQLWRNFLFLNNSGAGKVGCGLTYWSLGVSFQFYFLFPLVLCLLRPARPGFYPRLLKTLALLMGASCAFRVWSTSAADPVVFPLGVGAQDLAVPRIVPWFNHVYLPSFGRIPSLVAGVCLGLVLLDPGAAKKAHNMRKLVSIAAFIGELAVVVTSCLPWHGYGGEPEWPKSHAIVFGALLHNSGPLVAVAFSLSLLALALEADPLHATAAALFSSTYFAKLAEWSLGLYIFHPPALYFTFYWLDRTAFWRGLVAAQPGGAFTLVSTLVVLGGYAATVVYDMVSRAVLSATSKAKTT